MLPTIIATKDVFARSTQYYACPLSISSDLDSPSTSTCRNDQEISQVGDDPGCAASKDVHTTDRSCTVAGKDRETILTSTFSSGKHPSVFLSQTTRDSSAPGIDTQTLKRPAVSSLLRGTRVMAPMVGGGNVRNSSVWTQLARCNLDHR